MFLLSTNTSPVLLPVPLLCVLCVLCAVLVHAAVNPAEKAALLAFKNTWKNEDAFNLFSSWNNATDPCDDDWPGVACNCSSLPHSFASVCDWAEPQSHVVGLSLLESQPSLRQLSLNGRIPDEFAELTELAALELSNTNLTGGLNGSVVGSMGKLQLLSLNGNKLSGSIPVEIMDLPLLHTVNLAGNNFSGVVPSPCSTASDKKMEIDIRDNAGLCGVPEVVMNCTNSTEFRAFTFNYFGTDNVEFFANNFDPEICCSRPAPTCNNELGCGVMVDEFFSPLLNMTFNFTNFTVDPSTAEVAFKYSAELVALYAHLPVASLSLHDYGGLQLYRDEVLQDVPYSVYGSDGEFVGNFTGSVTSQVWNLSIGIPEQLSGEQVGIRILATDPLCPHTQGSTISRPITMVTDGPRALPVFNTDDFMYAASQTPDAPLGMSWQLWSDPVGAPCCYYWAQFFDITHAGAVNYSAPITDVLQYAVSERMYLGYNRVSASYMTSTQAGHLYVGVVFATNVVGHDNQEVLWDTLKGLVTMRMSTIITVVDHDNTSLVLGLSLGLGIGIPLLLLLLGMPWVVIIRERSYQHRKQLVAHRNATMTRMLSGVSSHTPHLNQDETYNIFGQTQTLAFVITDLENSTACAAADRKAYTDVQDIHDQIMREGIAEFNGYEVCTEGDSFQVAFLSAVDAVKWALETQRRLLEVDWPQRVLKLPSCNPVYVNGLRSFYGPRVRMGIHWATEGTFQTEEHTLTKMRVFHGPSWNLAKEVGDIGYGGQIVMTDSAWSELCVKMCAAAFPVVSCLGLYKLDKWVEPMWLYQVCEAIGNPIPRTFNKLRNKSALVGGRGYRIVLPPPFLPQPPPPESRSSRVSRVSYSVSCPSGSSSDAGQGSRLLLHLPSSSTWLADVMDMADSLQDQLVVVVARIEKWLHNDEYQVDRALLSSLVGVLRGSRDSSQAIPAWVLMKTYDILAMLAQQFQGYLVEDEFCDDSLTLTFASVQAAVAFCHSAQVALLNTEWTRQEKWSTHASLSSNPGGQSVPDILGPNSTTADGRLLFNGPRVAMAVHLAHDLQASYSSKGVRYNGVRYWPGDVAYSGADLDIAVACNRTLYGGQVVLTGITWQSLRDGVPWGVQVLSLGGHLIRDDITQVLELVEVLPTMLQMRDFPKLPSYKLVSPGFKDSPDPHFPVAICFAKVGTPAAVQDALETDKSQSDDALRGLLTTYFSSIILLEQVVRNLLPEFDGYECKNPEPGKFTLAFKMLENAVLYAAAVQLALLDVPWPQELLTLEECQEVFDEGGQRIWRGLRLHAGITWGKPDSRKPLNTGRADYFGSVANMSARVMCAAQPGQVLVQGTDTTHELGRAMPTSDDTAVVQTDRYVGTQTADDPRAVLVQTMGYYQLKGFSGHQEICSVTPTPLQARCFPPTNLESSSAPKKKRDNWGLGSLAPMMFADASREGSGQMKSDASFFAHTVRVPECLTGRTLSEFHQPTSNSAAPHNSQSSGVDTPSEDVPACGTASSHASQAFGTTSSTMCALTDDQISAARSLADVYVAGRQARQANMESRKWGPFMPSLRRQRSAALLRGPPSRREVDSSSSAGARGQVSLAGVGAQQVPLTSHTELT